MISIIPFFLAGFIRAICQCQIWQGYSRNYISCTFPVQYVKETLDIYIDSLATNGGFGIK